MASETRKRKRSPDELNETHKQHRGAEKDADDTDDSNNKDATNDGLAALLEDSGASAFLQSKFELLLFFFHVGSISTFQDWRIIFFSHHFLNRNLSHDIYL